MFSNRLAFAALAAGCIAAAAGGGYLASRQNAVPAPLGSMRRHRPRRSQRSRQPQPERPVQETEALVGDIPKPGASLEPAGAATPNRVCAGIEARHGRARLYARDEAGPREQRPSGTGPGPGNIIELVAKQSGRAGAQLHRARR